MVLPVFATCVPSCQVSFCLLCSVYAFFQGYLEVQIFNRMKKIQKPKRLAGNSEGEGGPSKAKKQKTKMHTWSEHPDMPEGEKLETLRTYANENREEVKRNPRKQKLHVSVIH